MLRAVRVHRDDGRNDPSGVIRRPRWVRRRRRIREVEGRRDEELRVVCFALSLHVSVRTHAQPEVCDNNAWGVSECGVVVSYCYVILLCEE